jgi:NitT/TauT family transport system permease protein
MKKIVYPVLSFIALLACWQFLPGHFNIPAFVLPPLSQVLATFTVPSTLALYADHALTTLSEALYGLIIGGGAGFIVGILMTQFPTLLLTVYPYIVALQCMPKVAIAPLLVIWFGFGITSKVLVVALLCFFPVLVNTISGIRSVSRDQLELFKAIKASRMGTLVHLLIPTALPSILTGVEIAVVVSLLGAIVGEFVGAQKGVGVLLQQAQFQMDIPAVFALLLVLAVVGVIFNLAVRIARRRLLFWMPGETGQDTTAA